MGILHVLNRKNGGKPYTSGVWERARGKKRVLAFKHMVAKETRKLTSPKHETSRDTVTPWHRDTVTPTYETFMKPPVNLLRTVLILSRFQCLLRILDSSNKHIAIWSLGTSNTYVKSCDAGSSIPSLNFMFINLLLHHSTEVASMDYHLKGPSGLRLRGVCVYIYICMYIYTYICVCVHSMMIVDLVFRPDSGYHPHHPIPKPASPL